jgi:hypothetical protein
LAPTRTWCNPSKRFVVTPFRIFLHFRSQHHLAPPVLILTSKSNRQDRLSALFKEAKDPIAAFDGKTNTDAIKNEGLGSATALKLRASGL